MELAAVGDDSKALRRIARNLIHAAGGADDNLGGDLAAIKEIGDRLDGKPAQAIENGEDGAFEVLQRIETVIVDPKGNNEG